MKRRLLKSICIILTAAMLTACAAEPVAENVLSPESSEAIVTEESTESSEAPEAEAASEISLKDDFYAAVNAEWMEIAEIPSDMPYVGGFTDLADDVEEILMVDFGKMLADEKEADNAALSNFIAFYRLAADFEKRNADGAAPLLTYMERVENLSSLAAFTKQWTEWELDGMPSPFALVVMADMKDAATNALYITPPSLFLLDKSYYEEGSQMKEILATSFSQMVVNLLVLAGKEEAEAAAITADAMTFDAMIAPYMQSAEEASDYTTIYNPIDFGEFDAQIEAFDFTKIYQEILGQIPDQIIVTNPTYFEVLSELVTEENFPVIKNWILVQTVTSLAPYLSNDFRLESGSFSRLVSGTAEAVDAETSAYYLASNMYGEAAGEYYGRTYFGESAKQDVTQMVENIVTVYESRIWNNTWLSEETKTLAVKKLNTMTINVGYPDKIDPLYEKMVPVSAEDGGSLLGNGMKFTRIVKEDNYARWNQPVDRSAWSLSADTVNAMYSPLNNSINFPAAILQAPFYSLEQSSSTNYGGIGAVIAHEISHAFDPNGAKFDELGNLTDWWTEADYAEFEKLSQKMVEEFNGLEHAGGAVNGTLTVTENVADAGGLACALEAAKLEADTDLEAFFTNWAVIWRQKATPEYEALLLMLDVHAPSALRANIQLQNMDDFFTTFDITEGDAMYRAPEDRVIIW